jgi:hypothetical protein
MTMTSRVFLTAIAVLALATMAIAQPRGATPPAATGAPGAQGAPRGGAPAGMGNAEVASLIFEEHWTRGPLTQPMNQSNLGNQDLVFHRMNVEYILSDLHWRALLMTDTPTNASNQRKPDPTLVPIIPLGKATPDLKQVEEAGFSDLMPGGWIPATTRVNAFALYGKKVAR